MKKKTHTHKYQTQLKDGTLGGTYPHTSVIDLYWEEYTACFFCILLIESQGTTQMVRVSFVSP